MLDHKKENLTVAEPRSIKIEKDKPYWICPICSKEFNEEQLKEILDHLAMHIRCLIYAVGRI